MLRTLGFDAVYGAEAIARFLHPEPVPVYTDWIQDRYVFAAMEKCLTERKNQPDASPFFMAMYNMETHVGIDSQPGDIPYGNGDNASLNSIHNFDAQFGRFYEYFLQSPYRDNTVLILTADHAHYPEACYVDIAGPDLQLFFVDRIPLLVYAPMLDLPASMDAQTRTSLDFAPTLLHLLGIQASNSFMGTSLFDPCPGAPHTAFAWIGRDGFLIDNNHIYAAREVPPDKRSAYTEFQQYVQTYYLYEQRNKVFPQKK